MRKFVCLLMGISLLTFIGCGFTTTTTETEKLVPAKPPIEKEINSETGNPQGVDEATGSVEAKPEGNNVESEGKAEEVAPNP
ncbi:MAG: hypothetical protein LBK06_10970, partial [Planctomycetaceae bacterium]|nr:hypothetical protein [Planctomycetaceae bacterium]